MIFRFFGFVPTDGLIIIFYSPLSHYTLCLNNKIYYVTCDTENLPNILCGLNANFVYLQLMTKITV